MNNISKLAAIASLLFISPLVLAQQSSTLDEDTFAIVNGKQIPNDLVDFIAGTEPLQDPQLKQLTRRLLANIAVAQEAEKLGLDKQSEISYELDLNRVQILARSYIEDYLSKNPITDEQVETRYTEFTLQAADLFEYQARHILVDAETAASELLNQIDGDLAKFEELAREHSIDTGSGANGGLLEWTVAETFVPEFAQALTGLVPGEFTESPVETQFGWHLIHLDDRRKVQVPELDDEQHQRVTEALRAERIQSEFDRVLNAAELQLSDAIEL